MRFDSDEELDASSGSTQTRTSGDEGTVEERDAKDTIMQLTATRRVRRPSRRTGCGWLAYHRVAQWGKHARCSTSTAIPI
jgi:hypothetical protein